MVNEELGERLTELCSRIQEYITPYAGRVDYGNLRNQISKWDCAHSGPITNIALVYETPGGSTDQINISYYHQTVLFAFVDAQEGEITTTSIDDVMHTVAERVTSIPAKRRETLCSEVRREIDSGNATSASGVMGHLNRLMQSEFKGGTITHLELRDAMMFAVQYINGKS